MIPSALQHAIQTLLETPVLTERMDSYKIVYPWRSEVRAWFERTAAWPVQLGPGVIRLVALSTVREGGRAFDGLKSPRACALVAWTLWFHEYLGLRVGEARQFSLSELSEAIAGPAGLDFTELTNRRALLQAVRSLAGLGALRILDDHTEGWDSSSANAGALLEFTPAAAYLISTPPLPAATPAQRATRALLVGPAFAQSDDPEAFDALHDERVSTALQEGLGWTVDVHPHYATLHREGLARGSAERWTPGRSVISAAALLLLQAVQQLVRDGQLTPDAYGRVTLTTYQLYPLLNAVRDEHRGKWGEAGKTGVEKLLAEVIQTWRSWGGLSATTDDRQLTLYPHLARFEALYSAEDAAKPTKRRPVDDAPTLF